MGLLSSLFGKKTTTTTTTTISSNLDKDTTKKEMISADSEYRNLMESLEWQDKLIATVQKAREKYEEDKKIDDLIKSYEYVLLEANPPIKNMRSLPISLAELYRKSNQNDKAWGYLNSLLLTHPELLDKIRFEQCKILKSEKKYIEAMEMLMCGYLYKSKWNNTFNEKHFTKDATPISNRLKWDSQKIEYLAYLIKSQVDKQNYREDTLIQNYRKALEQF